jgi:hypothetical protein
MARQYKNESSKNTFGYGLDASGRGQGQDAVCLNIFVYFVYVRTYDFFD